ncbi:MAG: hypothetical protein OQJ74_04825 [Ignavibacteriaceae bacterium]|nr:hypothetical protein [Ignavibacteriaceae bacterium]
MNRKFLSKIIQPIILCVILLGAVSNAQNLLNNPESIVFDSDRNRYLVSNWGDGSIVQIDSNGVQSYFSTAIQKRYNVAGLYIFGDTLLAASGDTLNSDTTGKGLTGFNLKTGEIIFHIPIPGIGLPNDITSDKDGAIYLTDYWDDKLYKIKNHTPSVYISKGILGYPNGMVYDSVNNRLLILSVMGPGAPIISVDLNDSSVTTVINTELNGTDGIAMDKAGRIYISEWTTDQIFMYDSNFNDPPEVFSKDHNDPADIYYDKINHLLAIPNFTSNTIDLVTIYPKSGSE